MNKKMTEFFTKYVNEKYNFDFQPTSIAQDLIKKLDYINSFQETYKSKKSNSPNWTSALEFWISEIETRIDKSKVDGLGKYYFNFLRGQELFFFQAMPEEDMDFTDLHCEYIIDNLFDAYSYAQFLDALKSELEHLKSINKTTKSLSNVDFNTDSVRLQNIEQPIATKPIIWTSDNVLLGYLVEWLKKHHFIAKSTSRDKTILDHFVDVEGNPIKNIRQGLQNMRDLNNGSLPQKYEKVEELLKDLIDLSK